MGRRTVTTRKDRGRSMGFKIMKAGSASWFSRFTLVQHLLVLSLTILLPQVLLGTLIARRYANEQRMELEQTAVVMVRERTASLDRELEGVIGALQALATSPLIDEGDFDRFRAQAFELLNFRGTAVVMRDRSGPAREQNRDFPNLGLTGIVRWRHR